MTTATIIQSARFNSTDSASNAEWVTNLKVPVILNQGDSVAVSQAYVDSRLNSSGNIVIPVDTPISLTYYFYYMFPCDGANTVSPAKTAQTGDEGVYLNNSFEDNPNNLVVLIGTPGSILVPFQGTDLNAAASGIPLAPYTNIPYDIQPYIAINQSYACDMPLLLVENKTIANGSRPYTKTWNYTIKAGSYSPANLADILTKNMASINPNPTTMNFTPYEQFGGEQLNPMSQNATDLNPFLAKGMNYAQFAYQYNPTYDDSIPTIIPYEDGIVQNNGLAFATNSPEFQNDPQEFAGVFADFLTDTMFDANFLGEYPAAIVTEGAPVSILPCKYVAQYNVLRGDAQQPSPNYDGMISYTSPLVGASEISLEFNTDTNVFQFTYLHTPLLQLPTTAGSTEPIEVVKVIKTINLTGSNFTDQQVPRGKVNISTNTRHSGVFFQSMEPKSFWQDIMGFDVDNITFDADYVWGANRQMNYEEFNKITTSSYVGILNNFNFTKGGSNYNNPAYTTAFSLDGLEAELTYSNLLNSARWWTEHYLLGENGGGQFAAPAGFNFNFHLVFSKYYEEYSSASIATNPLSAIQAPLSNIASSGHYLVSIDGYQNTKNDFINDNDIFNIKSIISNYYLSVGSFATQPFSSTAIYVHNSPIPKLINSLRIRLIEPTTMKEIAGLGPSSSVYLQINKIVSDLSVSQPG